MQPRQITQKILGIPRIPKKHFARMLTVLFCLQQMFQVSSLCENTSIRRQCRQWSMLQTTWSTVYQQVAARVRRRCWPASHTHVAVWIPKSRSSGPSCWGHSEEKEVLSCGSLTVTHPQCQWWSLQTRVLVLHVSLLAQSWNVYVLSRFCLNLPCLTVAQSHDCVTLTVHL